MTRPVPNPDRFKRPELQHAYEQGFRQEYEHESFALLDRFGWLLDSASGLAVGAELTAAMLDGAADALHALARQRRADLRTLRLMDGEEP